MYKKASYFSGTVFGKEGPYTCWILFDLKLLKIIRFRTNWDNGNFYIWNTRIKFFWNIIDEE